MRILKQCLHCGADFLVQPSEVPKRHTCSRKCKAARETGNKKKYPREYQKYHSAKHRCTNKNSTSWSDYGGRGIQFNLNSFDEFIEHLGSCPEGWTLEREDNDGDYEIEISSGQLVLIRIGTKTFHLPSGQASEAIEVFPQ